MYVVELDEGVGCPVAYRSATGHSSGRVVLQPGSGIERALHEDLPPVRGVQMVGNVIGMRNHRTQENRQKHCHQQADCASSVASHSEGIVVPVGSGQK